MSMIWRRRATRSASARTLRAGYCSGFWPNALSKHGNDFGIKPISFGEPTDGACERPKLARIEDGEPKPGTRHRRRHRSLETTYRLEDDEFRSQAEEARYELFESIGVCGRLNASPLGRRWTSR
jgi:hypothetical protein